MKTRSAEETKTETISFKVTANQNKKIREKAEESGTSMSRFIVEKVLHGESLHPHTIVQVQDIINMAMNLAQQFDPKKINEISRLEKNIWSSLK